VKALIFSDIHLDAHTAGKARRAEVIGFLDAAWLIAEREQVDLVIFAGDAHDPGSLLDPMYSSDLIRHFSKFPQASFAPTFVAVAGNHDVVDTSELFLQSPVTTLTPFRIAAQHMRSADRVHVFERPRAIGILDDWAVLGLPYVARAHAASNAAWETSAIEQARKYVDAGKRLIVVGHKVIPGARMSSESVEMAKGQDQIFPFEQVDSLKPALVINGHYHSRQHLNIYPSATPTAIYIPGSPVRFTFGEAEEVNKGVMLVNL
jgi:DNA repair exonuclease SbcCD nuclease subunit